MSEQLGHSSPASTYERYGHLIPRDCRGEVSFLDAMMPNTLHLSAPQAYLQLGSRKWSR